MPNSRRYEQPYSSKHVLHDTTDTIRAQEPAYIKNFPRFVHQLYKKQTPFNSIVLANLQAVSRNKTNSSRGQVASRSVAINREASNNVAGGRSQAHKSARQADPAHQAQPAGFQTLGQKTTKSPQQQMSSVPSDFEHIFHYSETQ